MAEHTTFRPFVPANEDRKELSIRALLLGSIFGVIFGAVTVYVGLRAGLTVAASIPISVLDLDPARVLASLHPRKQHRADDWQCGPVHCVGRNLHAACAYLLRVRS